MLRLKISACIESSPEQTWAVLSNIENISDWAEPVLSARCTSVERKGIGAERVCDLQGNIQISEKWIEWQEGRSFTYQGYGLPLVEEATNTWSIVPSKGKSLLVSQSTIKLKGGIWGRLLEPLMKLLSRRMAADSLAAFKYLVENGHPYRGKFSSLPRVPALC